MRIQIEKHAVVLATVMGVAAFGAERAQGAVTLKEALKCRTTVATKVNGLITTGLGVVNACHAARDKGKAPGVDCNLLTTADLKGKFAKLVGKFAGDVDKQCAADNPVRNNFPTGFTTDAIGRVRNAIEANSDALLGLPTLTKEQKAEIKCHGAIAKGRNAIVTEIVKSGGKCQKGADKTAATVEQLVAIASSCVVSPAKAAKVAEAICKACGGKDKKCDGSADEVSPAAVDACAPLPACVVDGATASGQELARALYGEPTVCGNNEVEVGEICDDGNAVDGDGCDSDCTPTLCGNGVTTTGEQCDDGNDLDSDQCVEDCKLATCGDGFVHAGVELCGDTGTFCTDPTKCPDKLVEDCAPNGVTKTIVASISSPEEIDGLTMILDYPEHDSVVPGVGENPGKRKCVGGTSVNSFCTNDAACPGGACSNQQTRIVVVPAPPTATSPVVTINDENFEVLSSYIAFPNTFASGPFLRVKLDTCQGKVDPTIDEFACIVVNASKDGGGTDLTSQVTCSIAFE